MNVNKQTLLIWSFEFITLYSTKSVRSVITAKDTEKCKYLDFIHRFYSCTAVWMLSYNHDVESEPPKNGKSKTWMKAVFDLCKFIRDILIPLCNLRALKMGINTKCCKNEILKVQLNFTKCDYKSLGTRTSDYCINIVM